MQLSAHFHILNAKYESANKIGMVVIKMAWEMVTIIGYICLSILSIRSFISFLAVMMWWIQQLARLLFDERQVDYWWAKLPIGMRLQQQHLELRVANLINGIAGYLILTASTHYYWTPELVFAGTVSIWAWGLIGIALVINSYQRRYLRYYRQHPLS